MKEFMKCWKIAGLGVVAFALTGCNTGKDSLVFVTKTSYGVDIDRTPPTLDIAYGRKEGMLGPVYESGVNLPVMASFHSTANFFSRNGVGQSFATGNSAELLARYLGTASTLEDNSDISLTNITGKSTVDVGNGNPKRHFFGTATSFGFRVQFAEETAYMPESINLGFKRKEFAYVPLRVVDASGVKQVSLPSLVATVGFDNEVKTGFVDMVSKTNSSPATAATQLETNETNRVASVPVGTNPVTKELSKPDAKARANQFFATGKAADYLMSRSMIRDTIGFKILDDSDVKRKLQAKMETETMTFNDQVKHAGDIQRKFANVDSVKQGEIIQQAVLLGLVKPGTSNADFSQTLSDAVRRDMPDRTKSFSQLAAYANSR